MFFVLTPLLDFLSINLNGEVFVDKGPNIYWRSVPVHSEFGMGQLFII
jgi:4-amino-4-deoxy-L-arabinose transferase-like glycosyltransferase